MISRYAQEALNKMRQGLKIQFKTDRLCAGYGGEPPRMELTVELVFEGEVISSGKVEIDQK